MSQAPSCPVCESTTWTPRPCGYRFQGTHYRRVRCDSCGLFGLAPLPEPALLPSLYSDGYFANYSVHGAVTRGYVAGCVEAQRHAERRLDVMGRFGPRGRLLDVGCAGGHFLGAARARGYKVLGVELNASMAEHARSTYGVDVICADVFNARLEGCFDFVHLEDVLEHVCAPFETLVKLRRHLAPGGHLVIDGPLERQPALPLALLELNLLLRQPLDPEMSPHHIWQFTRATQERLLRRAGFEQVYTRLYSERPLPIPPGPNPVASLRRAVANGIGRLAAQLSPLLSQLGVGDRALVVCRAFEP